MVSPTPSSTRGSDTLPLSSPRHSSSPSSPVIKFSQPARRTLHQTWKRLKVAINSSASSGISESLRDPNDDSDGPTLPVDQRRRRGKGDLEAGEVVEKVDEVVVDNKEDPGEWIKGKNGEEHEDGPGQPERAKSNHAGSSQVDPIGEESWSYSDYIFARSWTKLFSLGIQTHCSKQPFGRRYGGSLPPGLMFDGSDCEETETHITFSPSFSTAMAFTKSHTYLWLSVPRPHFHLKHRVDTSSVEPMGLYLELLPLARPDRASISNGSLQLATKVSMGVANLRRARDLADHILVTDSANGLEVTALHSSLQMMSQVLNDVLDLSRMEKGGFSSCSRPFSLHQAMQSMVAPLQMDAQGRGLTLETSFDPRIDEVARMAVGLDAVGSEADAIVLGDEMRLRQVITNLASNATKFTLPGGKVEIRSRLVFPTPVNPQTRINVQQQSDDSYATCATLVSRPPDPQPDCMVVRIEVTDSGVGIHPRDVGGLFRPYVQTEAGLSQGGKGTGLGLSLVRQIVALSGGRLGVKSLLGHGSTMWVELPFAIGPAILEAGITFNGDKKLKLAQVLATPRSADDDRHMEFDFLSTPPSIRDPNSPPVASPTNIDFEGKPEVEHPFDRTPRQSLHRLQGPPAD
ncbi:hypothetical protein P7C70_g8250, partial [Phenoliferia sp. Uapishka_3]